VDSSVADVFSAEILTDFPEITAGGSYALSEVSPGPRFNELLAELNGADFRYFISKNLEVDLR